MNSQRDALSKGLRELASASPAASADLHTRLGEAFVQHHAQRRLRRRVAVVIGLAACLAICVYWLRPRGQVAKVIVVEPAAQSAQVPSPVLKPVAPEASKPSAPSIARASRKPRVRGKVETEARNHDGAEPPPATVEAADFVALPSFDPAIPVGESHMVRMNLPGSALQLIGYPVDGQLLERHILTDVLVGQDGMPYAVRLVQARNIH